MSPQVMKKPATAPWGLRISASDLQKLRSGFKPQDQDDKWFYWASATGGRSMIVHIARSAFNYDMFLLHVVVKPRWAEIASITWETNRGCREERQAKKEVVGITMSVLGCDFEQAPEARY